MKKTKIICTMGPNTDNYEIMKGLAMNQMDVARFNFSHGSYAEHKGRLELLKTVRKEVGRPIAALLDTKGHGNPYRTAEGSSEGCFGGRPDLYPYYP